MPGSSDPHKHIAQHLSIKTCWEALWSKCMHMTFISRVAAVWSTDPGRMVVWTNKALQSNNMARMLTKWMGNRRTKLACACRQLSEETKTRKWNCYERQYGHFDTERWWLKCKPTLDSPEHECGKCTSNNLKHIVACPSITLFLL